MSSLTKSIEAYIVSLFEEATQDEISLRRKDIAEKFGCVPSQINYVLRSRFAPEHGFIVSSQRGGNGYIRIMQLRFNNCEERLVHFEDLVGNVMSEQESRRLLASLQNRSILSARERILMEVALRKQDEIARSTYDIPPYRRDLQRAELMKSLLRSLALA